MILEMWELGYNLREMKDRQALYSENDENDLSSLLSYIQALTFLKS